MKIVPHRATLAEGAAQQEDTTANFSAGTEGSGRRRIVVTVERETLSIFMRRSQVEAAATEVAPLASSESTTELADKDSPAASPKKQKKHSGGKP
jgi:hypothetical protein